MRSVSKINSLFATSDSFCLITSGMSNPNHNVARTEHLLCAGTKAKNKTLEVYLYICIVIVLISFIFPHELYDKNKCSVMYR